MKWREADYQTLAHIRPALESSGISTAVLLEESEEARGQRVREERTRLPNSHIHQNTTLCYHADKASHT